MVSCLAKPATGWRTPITKPVVTVIVPTYRRPPTLEVALESVARQTFGEFEVVVADDAADPNTAGIVSERDGRFRYVPRANTLGVGANIATAIEDARGCFVTILCDDDWWAPTFLAEVLAGFKTSSVAVSFSDHWVTDESGMVDFRASDGLSAAYGRSSLRAGTHRIEPDEAALSGIIPSYISAVVRRSAFNSNDLSGLAGCGPHYDVFLSWLAARGGAVSYTPQRLAYYRCHERMQTFTGGTASSAGYVELWRRVLAAPTAGRKPETVRRLRARLSLALTHHARRVAAQGGRGRAIGLLGQALLAHPHRGILFASRQLWHPRAEVPSLPEWWPGN